MLTRGIAKETRPQLNTNWTWGVMVAVVVFAGLIWMLSSWSGFITSPQPLSTSIDPVNQLGQALVSPNAYILPFELASLLLLAALIGSIIIASERK
jgi:NADH-quinone oxidoreductase subunit J